MVKSQRHPAVQKRYYPVGLSVQLCSKLVLNNPYKLTEYEALELIAIDPVISCDNPRESMAFGESI